MPIVVGGGAEPCKVGETRFVTFLLCPFGMRPQATTFASGIACRFITGRAGDLVHPVPSMKVTQQPHNSGASKRRMVEINLAAVCDCDATDVILLWIAGG